MLLLDKNGSVFCPGDVHMAALYMLSLRDVEGAVGAYSRAGLIHEAVTLAAARLLPGNPMLVEVASMWGQYLQAQGHFESAAAAFLTGTCLYIDGAMLSL